MVITLGCTKEQTNKDEIVINIEGTWDMYSSQSFLCGTITFDIDEWYYMEGIKGEMFGDFSRTTTDNVLSLTVDDEPRFVKYTPIEKDKCYMENLPFYENEKLLLIKQK